MKVEPKTITKMANETLLWNRILAVVLKMPGVKVNRVEFLSHALSPYCTEQKLAMLPSVRPYTITTDANIDKAANSCINYHTMLATTASTIAGLPGGLAMAATIPGDLTQYYFHVFVLSQKLAYLYGFPDFCDEEGNLSDAASDLLTIFLGSMMGAHVADQGINELAIGVAKSTVGRLPRVVITKTAIYPIASQVAKIIGLKLSKEGFARGVGKFIPIAGGLFSGGLTLFTFKPGARRLQNRLKAQKTHFDDGDIDALEYNNIKASFVKAERSQNDVAGKQLAVLQAMINMANINGSVSDVRYKVVEERVAMSGISEEQMLELLGNVGSADSDNHSFSYDLDYDLLACDVDLAEEAIRSMLSVMRADGQQPTMAEKMYLTMTAKTIGVGKERLQEIENEFPISNE